MILLRPVALTAATRAGSFPGVHRGPVHHQVLGEDRLELRQQWSGERLGRDRGQHHRNVEDACRLGQAGGGVDDRGAVAAAGAEEHLRLVVDEEHHRVFRRQQV
jgi:hypothetical protein